MAEPIAQHAVGILTEQRRRRERRLRQGRLPGRADDLDTTRFRMVNLEDQLALANVISVGGSWPAPKELIAAHDFARITALAKEAAKLR